MSSNTSFPMRTTTGSSLNTKPRRRRSSNASNKRCRVVVEGSEQHREPLCKRSKQQGLKDEEAAAAGSAWLELHQQQQNKLGADGEQESVATHENLYMSQQVALQHYIHRELLQEEDPLIVVGSLFNLLALSGDKEPSSSPGPYSGTDDGLLLIDTPSCPYNASQRYCIRLLRSMLPTLEAVEHRPRSVQTIWSAMSRHQDCLQVQMEACQHLQVLLKPAEDVVFFPRELLAVLLRTLHRHSENATLQHYLLDLIRRLRSCLKSPNEWHRDIPYDNPETEEEEALNATQVIFASIAARKEVASIQQIGLSVLAWLVEDEHARRHVLEEHGIQTIPTIMKLHAQDSLIQCNAAATLCWLIHAGATTSIMAAASTAAEAASAAARQRPVLVTEHLETLLSVLTTHLDNCSVFGNCVCVLCGLTSREPLPHESEFFQIVLKGMSLHLESPKVQECCLRWLRFRRIQQQQQQRTPTESAASSETVQGYLKGSIELILNGMRYHQGDVHLQAQACDVLASLCDAPELRLALLGKGAVDAVLATLVLQQNNPNGDFRVQQSALWFLNLLLMTSTGEDGEQQAVLNRQERAPEGDESSNANHVMNAEAVAAFGGDFRVIETIWNCTSNSGNADTTLVVDTQTTEDAQG